jgi:hypothetical protein
VAEIPLKRKYTDRTPAKKGGSSTGGHSGNKKRNKLSQQEKARLPKQPVIVLEVNAQTGHSRFVKRGQNV